MNLSTKMMLWFGGVWFTTKFIDALFPPAHEAFNAALAVMAALCCAADYLTEPKSHSRKV